MSPYRRIPMVRDIEYLTAFLRGYSVGGMEEAEKTVRKVMLEFEKEKDRAVGRGRKLDEQKMCLRSLLSECMRICKEMGVIQKDMLSIKTEDPQVKILLRGNFRDPAYCSTIAEKLMITYSSFGDILFKIRATTEGKIYVSHDREKQRFKESIERYNFDVTQWTFEAARDLATQLGFINWRMLNHDEVIQDPTLGKTGYVVYMISTMAKLSELENINIMQLPTGFAGYCVKSCYEDLSGEDFQNQHINLQRAKIKGYSVIDLQNDYLFVKRFEVDEKRFEEVLWREYLKLCNHIPREPVYYSVLRDRVCEIMRISDGLFDAMIQKMLREPSRYEVKVSPGTGTMPLELVVSRKHIPPKLVSDIYIVYLLMEKSRRV